MRIGHGYDVHAFCDGDHLVLGGINIPFNKSFIAHSDGDVLIHAIMDSLLGAAGLPNIGVLFPDSSKEYENIDSKIMLNMVSKELNKHGFEIEYIDSTIIAQEPKINPYILEMRKAISLALSIDIDRINIKATTEEKLGFTGRKEGIAAHAVCLLK